MSDLLGEMGCRERERGMKESLDSVFVLKLMLVIIVIANVVIKGAKTKEMS